MRFISLVTVHIIAISAFPGCRSGGSDAERATGEGKSGETSAGSVHAYPEHVSFRPFHLSGVEKEQIKDVFADFQMNHVNFDQLRLTDIEVKQGARRIPVLFTSESFPGVSNEYNNKIDVIHSWDSECTIISGYVMLGTSHVYITALTENRSTGDIISIPCIWGNAKKSSFSKSYDFLELGTKIDGNLWVDAKIEKPGHIFLRAIIIANNRDSMRKCGIGYSQELIRV